MEAAEGVDVLVLPLKESSTPPDGKVGARLMNAWAVTPMVVVVAWMRVVEIYPLVVPTEICLLVVQCSSGMTSLAG